MYMGENRMHIHETNYIYRLICIKQTPIKVLEWQGQFICLY